LWRSSGTISASCCRRLQAGESRQFWG
jgi:hypothetical protein